MILAHGSIAGNPSWLPQSYQTNGNWDFNLGLMSWINLKREMSGLIKPLYKQGLIRLLECILGKYIIIPLNIFIPAPVS